MSWGEILALVSTAISGIAALVQIWWAVDDHRSSRATSEVKKRRPSNTQIIPKQLLKLISTSDEEADNIIGDLLEECDLYPSKLKARIWLYKQVLKSAPPLIYKSIRGRLASYFGKRIR
jgi:hypothetical protein